MKHNSNTNYNFVQSPIEFNKWTDRETLQYCLGAVLYMPGTKNIIDKIMARELSDLKSMVMCFEDAIAENDLNKAEENVINHLRIISDAVGAKELCKNDVPLLFVRVRNTQQFVNFTERLTDSMAEVLAGFVFKIQHDQCCRLS